MTQGSHSSRCAAMARSTSSGSVPSRCSVTSSTNSRQATEIESSAAGRGGGSSGTVTSFPGASPVHVLQPRPQAGAAPVQQYPLIARAEAEQSAHLVGREPMDVPQLDDRALALGQLVQRAAQFS